MASNNPIDVHFKKHKIRICIFDEIVVHHFFVLYLLELESVVVVAEFQSGILALLADGIIVFAVGVQVFDSFWSRHPWHYNILHAGSLMRGYGVIPPFEGLGKILCFQLFVRKGLGGVGRQNFHAVFFDISLKFLWRLTIKFSAGVPGCFYRRISHFTDSFHCGFVIFFEHIAQRIKLERDVLFYGARGALGQERISDKCGK